MARGKYIMFVDVDDLIEEDLLSRLQPFMEKEIDIIKYKMRVVKGKNVAAVGGPVFDVVTGEEAFNKLCFKDKLLDSPCLYLIKREYFEKIGLGFKENMYHEDFGLIPLLIVNAKTFISTDIVGYRYIQTENSIMRNNDYTKEIEKVSNKFEHYENMLDYLKRFKISGDTKENLKTYYINSVILSLKRLRIKDRVFFEKRIKEMKMIDNLKANNSKQIIKKIILKNNIELYLRLKGC